MTKEFNAVEFMRQQNSEKGFRNQQQGMQFEFKVLKKYKKRSDVLWAIRSAGSHSAIDIVVQYKNGQQKWIVCKVNSYVEPSERLELSNVIKFKPANVSVVMYYYRSQKCMSYTKIA